MKPGKVGGILSFTDTEGKHLFPSLGMIPAVEILGAPLLTESGDKGLKNAAFLPDSSPNCPYLTTFFFVLSHPSICTAVFIAWAGTGILKIEMLLIR